MELSGYCPQTAPVLSDLGLAHGDWPNLIIWNVTIRVTVICTHMIGRKQSQCLAYIITTNRPI